MSDDVTNRLRDQLIALGCSDLAGGIKSTPVVKPPTTTVSKLEASLEKFIGVSHGVIELKQKVRVLAPHNISVLILGPTGTGKELIAEALHGNRPTKFVPVNCGGIPSELLEAEFFGAVKGSYTGCTSDRVGYLHEADGGTLFLDEIGELPGLMQAKLLRVLQNKTFRRVGSMIEERSNFRLVSATNRENLHASPDKFRVDLYYRIAATLLYTPMFTYEDIHLIIRKFAKNTEVAEKLCAGWTPTYSSNLPGNIRQLLNMIEEANIFYAS